MITKIADDFELRVTRERLDGAFKALNSCGTEDVDYAIVQSILFTIVNLQREIIEYLDFKIGHQSQITSATHTVANQSPRQIDELTQTE